MAGVFRLDALGRLAEFNTGRDAIADRAFAAIADARDADGVGILRPLLIRSQEAVRALSSRCR